MRGEIEVKFKERLEREKELEMGRYQEELERKDMKIRQLETEMHLKHLSNLEEQRRI